MQNDCINIFQINQDLGLFALCLDLKIRPHVMALSFILILQLNTQLTQSFSNLEKLCLLVKYIKGRTIIDLGGGAWAKVGKKNQRLLAQEKNSNQQPKRKKVQRLVAEEKKLNTNSLPEAPPDH